MKKQPFPKALPPGGMPTVLHSTPPKPVTGKSYEGFLQDVADTYEGITKKVSDFAWKTTQTAEMGQSMIDRANPRVELQITVLEEPQAELQYQGTLDSDATASDDTA